MSQTINSKILSSRRRSGGAAKVYDIQQHQPVPIIVMFAVQFVNKACQKLLCLALDMIHSASSLHSPPPWYLFTGSCTYLPSVWCRLPANSCSVSTSPCTLGHVYGNVNHVRMCRWVRCNGAEGIHNDNKAFRMHVNSTAFITSPTFACSMKLKWNIFWTV